MEKRAIERDCPFTGTGKYMGFHLSSPSYVVHATDLLSTQNTYMSFSWGMECRGPMAIKALKYNKITLYFSVPPDLFKFGFIQILFPPKETTFTIKCVFSITCR